MKGGVPMMTRRARSLRLEAFEDRSLPSPMHGSLEPPGHALRQKDQEDTRPAHGRSESGDRRDERLESITIVLLPVNRVIVPTATERAAPRHTSEPRVVAPE